MPNRTREPRPHMTSGVPSRREKLSGLGIGNTLSRGLGYTTAMACKHPLRSPPQTLRGHLYRPLPRIMASVGQNGDRAVQTDVMLIKLASAVAIMVSALGACGPGPVTSHLGHVRVGSHANWPTYHADARRSGSVAGLPAAGRLALGWARRLDGALYGQPPVIGDQGISATEGGTVSGLSLASGRGGR